MKQDESLLCWAASRHSQPITAEGDFTSVSGTGSDACAIKKDGSLVCWGNRITPDSPFLEDSFSSVSVGSQICGAKTDGALVCWGRPSGRNQPTPSPWDVQYREVCLAETVDSVQCDDLEPVGLANLEGTFSTITVAGRSFCGIKTDGYLVCQDEVRGFRSLPPSGPITSLSISGGSVCGLQADGTIACWMAPRPDIPPGSFISLVTGPWICGLKSDGSVACQGDGSSDRGTVPSGPFTSISAGGVLPGWASSAA